MTFFSSEANQIIPIIALILSFISILVAIFAFLIVRGLNTRSKLFFSGKKGQDLEKIIINHANEIKSLDKDIQELFEISNKIHKLAFKSIHKIGVIRFNPFRDIGGDQSFAIAFLDGKDNGLILSSLHTREGTRVYSKPVEKGISASHSFTDEEKRAIEMAQNQNIAKKL